MYGIYDLSDINYIVMEYMELGSLDNLLIIQKNRLKEENLIDFSCQGF